MRGTRERLVWLGLCTLLTGAGCGGERQDAGAPSGAFALDVTQASFPRRQSVAEASTLRLRIANRGERAVPALSVTVETAPGASGESPVAFGRRSADPGVADTARPVWILDEGPAGGDSAYVNTWSVGRLGPGRERTLTWRLTAVQAGRFTLAWRLAPALEGDVRLRGGRTEGRFAVTVSDAPVPARVGRDGRVVRGRP